MWSSNSGSRAFEDDELAIDFLGLGRCPGWRVGEDWRNICSDSGSSGLNHGLGLKEVEPEYRKNKLHLRDEVLHVRDVGFGQEWDRGGGTIMNGCSVGFFCQRDQATLNVSSMRLRDVLVLADNDRTADPELLGLVVYSIWIHSQNNLPHNSVPDRAARSG